MDIVKNKKEGNKLTGVSRIIFEYCSFPRVFEEELNDKTKIIYKILNSQNIDFDTHADIYINSSGKWILGYPLDYIRFSNKHYIIDKLYDRKSEYDKIMGFGNVQILGNECYCNY